MAWQASLSSGMDWSGKARRAAVVEWYTHLTHHQA